MKYLTVASTENLYILSIEIEMVREEVIGSQLKGTTAHFQEFCS
jgi:hypothetical protein